MKTRVVQLAAGIAAMVAIANLQYGWTLFVGPISARFGWEATAVQLPFTIFVLAETWLVPGEAYLVDRYGPRLLVTIGAAMVAAAWLLNSMATSLGMFCLGGAIAGAGAGIVYGTAIGNALKWFPDRRGLAAGLTAAAFGAGAALTVWPMAAMIRGSGYPATFAVFGVLQGLVVLIAAQVMRAPKAEQGPSIIPPARVRQGSRDCSPAEVARTPLFWLMYVMMTMTSMGGLMVIAQVAPMAKHFGVAEVPIHVFGLSLAALPLAMSLDRVLNGVTRPFFGWVSDHLGRENTMFIAFTLEGAAILLLIQFAHVPLAFVLLTGLTFFAWGEIYSLFPALSGDLFGRRFASTNYGLLYTAKGTASLLVPLGSWLHERSGSWTPIFLLAVVFDWTAALLALFVLKRACARWLAAQRSGSACSAGERPQCLSRKRESN